MEQIQELHRTGEDMKNRLAELETLTEHQRFAEQEFAFSRRMIESFAANVDDCTVEEKRRLLRAIVKKWSGTAKTPGFNYLQEKESPICRL